MLNFVPDQPPTGWRWYVNMVLTTILCAFFTVMLGIGTWTTAADDGDLKGAAFLCACTLLFLVIPLAGFYLKNRNAEILCPQQIEVDGQSALRYPGDRRGMHVGAALWPVLALLPIAIGLPKDGDALHPSSIVFFAPAAFFISYTLFALAGRFNEEGTTLTSQGVTIRARGLRAELPWTSIAGSTTYKQPPFPYERIAIHLHPGSPREVSVTVPWWIGSPRPRKDTVFLTKVQVPGFYKESPHTNPGVRINQYLNDHTRLSSW